MSKERKNDYRKYGKYADLYAQLPEGGSFFVSVRVKAKHLIRGDKPPSI